MSAILNIVDTSTTCDRSYIRAERPRHGRTEGPSAGTDCPGRIWLVRCSWERIPALNLAPDLAGVLSGHPHPYKRADPSGRSKDDYSRRRVADIPTARPIQEDRACSTASDRTTATTGKPISRGWSNCFSARMK